ncbi:MAG: hypothetical protein RL563_188 [Pseudomonadota bacterium]
MESSSKHYQQLQPEDRATISSLKQQNYGPRAIARILKRPASTISRELRRNGFIDDYSSVKAQQASQQRRRQSRPKPKLHVDSVLFGVVHHFLKQRWSPEQIALAQSALYPKGHEYRVSHETIYNCIYAQPVGELKRELIACLRQAKNKRVVDWLMDMGLPSNGTRMSLVQPLNSPTHMQSRAFLFNTSHQGE